MKLIRMGEVGQEKPGVLLEGGTRLDVSGFGSDYDEAFFASDDAEDAYTFARLDNALQSWLEVCAEAGLEDELPLSVVGDYWLSQLDQAALSQRFFAGAVTFATLMPMRAIPFRRVCLLGMNDGDYPRPRVPMDFDLMRGYSRPGDRSRREDDRYLLLEAFLARTGAPHS